MIGIKKSSTHQPLLFRSCSLLTQTARLGNKKAKATSVETSSDFSYMVDALMSMQIATISIRKLKTPNHQYSDLDALPSNFA